MADQTIVYTEEMVGSGHPTKADTLNRLALVAHNTDGTTKMKLGTFTRDMTAASGDVAYTGVGFTPTLILMVADVPATPAMSVGAATTAVNIANYYNGPDAGWANTGSYCMGLQPAEAAHNQLALLKTFDADGFTLTWTKNNDPGAGTAAIIYIAWR